MTAKELILDFLELAFIIFLCVFVLFYFILGNRLEIFKMIFDLAVPLILFLIPLVIILRTRRLDIKKMRKENNLMDIISYLSKGDKIKDGIIIFLTSVIVLIIAIIDKNIKMTDYFQAIAVSIVMVPWHIYLFNSRSENVTQLTALLYVDKFKDELIIFFLPLLLIAIGMIGVEVTIVDYIQAVIAFAILYFWHQLLFGRNN